MPLKRSFGAVLQKHIPLWMRYGLATLFVLLALLVRGGLNSIWPSQGFPFLFFIYSIVASAVLGTGGAGYYATACSAVLCLFFIPQSEFTLIALDWVLPLLVFITLGLGMTAIIETLLHILEELQETERRRGLLLVEYRHRTRNDLMSVGAILLLRARWVLEDSARLALREAAAHTRDLSRIHSRMANAAHDLDDVPIINTRCFVFGMCADLVPPVVSVTADSAQLPTERAVQVGLLLTELVAEARQGGAGSVAVQFLHCDLDFLLRVIDDRTTASLADGLRSRMVQMLATQLRGTLSRTSPEDGGSTAEVRFPVAAPSLAPGRF